MIYYIWCVTVICSNCSPSAFVYLFSVKLLTALLIGAVAGCRRSPAALLLVRWLIWILDEACDRLPTSRPRHGSPRFRRIWRPLIVSDEFRQLTWSYFCANCDACLSLIAVVERDQWYGLRPSVLGRDRSETKKSVLVLVLVLQVWCCVVKHGQLTLSS